MKIALSIIFFSGVFISFGSDKQLDNFSSTALFYMAASGGNITGTINSTTVKEGAYSLQVNYMLNGGVGNFVEVFRSYSTSTLDLSFMPDKLSLWVYGQAGNSNRLKFMLYEDNDMDGNPFEAGDEIYEYISPTILSTPSWNQLNMPYLSFARFGGGVGTLNLNRIYGWRILIENTGASSYTGTVFFDDFRQHTAYNAPSTGVSTLTGSFIQLWNTDGCNCGQWTQAQWESQMNLMKDACLNTIIIQYSLLYRQCLVSLLSFLCNLY